LGFDQAELIEGHQRLLVCSGQDAVDADGKPQHPGDMAAQLDELIGQHFARITERFGSSRYATSIVGVAHLPAQFLVMLEATAVD